MEGLWSTPQCGEACNYRAAQWKVCGQPLDFLDWTDFLAANFRMALNCPTSPGRRSGEVGQFSSNLPRAGVIFLGLLMEKLVITRLPQGRCLADLLSGFSSW